MPALQQRADDTAPPSPFPVGWYLVATRASVLKHRLIAKQWMGQDIVVWSDDDGNICVADAYCPHMGSFLGPESGGSVCEGRLICPFHGFEFEADGRCAATPFAAAPRSANLGIYATREICGLVFAWWGNEDREPQWELPDEEPDQTGWSGVSVQTLRFPGHPQETAENSVDIAHLRYVHGYHHVNGEYPVVVDGPRLESEFDFSRTQSIGKLDIATLDVHARAELYGLGYSIVEGREQSIGMDFRLWVLATPVNGRLIDLTLAAQIGELTRPNRRIVGLGFLPVAWRAPLMNRITSFYQRRDVLQDVTVWSRKRYRARPRLCRSDGEIMTYREYCTQFYPGNGEPDSQLDLPSERATTAEAAAR
ncbi:MAG: Rieske 2Fe-2S domain-containing protein [Chloroflexi bacterium]|nr:Rieske 2Fe-2S domain-containing protein [Chloroflexota bacterium]MCY3695693.1 Rieske 2Fe-2S domain-containing protein [Chloroflexota bacterium]